ncbi:MAG: ParB/RepB/Spo0J family partition protein [Candidatus Margulisbacteria bacterium]|nr:ParB/RepB/Spo0J family partition protein [Candidatus Margulisiibacteriota bacterium]
MSKKKDVKKPKESKKLDAAFVKAVKVAASQSKEMDISLIDLTGWNPRGEDSYKDEAFGELKQSMKENGFFKHEPLLVRAVGDRYQLIAGHRRLRAAQDLNFKFVPVSIQYVNDQDAKLLIFLDNLHRKDFSPLEEAAGIKQVLDDGAVTQTELAKKMGMSQAYVANRLRLLEAPEELKAMIISQEITPSHVNVLLSFIGYSVFEDMITNLKEVLFDGPVTVKDLEDDIVWGTLRSSEAALNLDDFSYEIKKFRDFFDFGLCPDCNDFRQVLSYKDEKNRVCINQNCWSVKLAAAQKAYELAEDKKARNLLNKDKVDISKMSYGTYMVLKNASWDQTACTSCDKCKKDKDKELICLDVKCFDKKEKVWNTEKQRLLEVAEEVAEEEAWLICDHKLECLVAIDIKVLRSIVLRLAEGPLASIAEEGLKLWDGATDEEGNVDISKIPDDDIPKALIRLIVAENFECGDPTVEAMDKFLEELGV